MDTDYCHTDLPVLLLYDADPTWEQKQVKDRHAEAHYLRDSLVEVGHPVRAVCIQSADLETALHGFHPDEHLIFNWCEELPGIPRSASHVAYTLDQLGFTYTGTGARALDLSQDKRLVKARLRARGISTPEWMTVTTASAIQWDYFPAIVKPAFEHCSLGITRDAVVRSPAELAERVRYVLETFLQPVLIEEFIDGRELHIAVLGNGKLHTLFPAEMDFSAFADVRDRLYAYETKFDPFSNSYNLTELHLPARLTEIEQCQIEEIAISAYRATGCRDYARMDLRLRDGVFYLLDVNPNSDLTPENSLVLAAEKAGLPYGRLGSLLINLAAQRHAKFRGGRTIK